MRNPPDHYLQTLREHFTVAPSFAEPTALQVLPQPGAADHSLQTTNQLAQGTAFQRWFHFKEAFSPAFVTNAINTLGFRPTRLIDPFGGSGTSAITCQLLGIDAITVEVNPFLADVIKTKVQAVSAEALRRAAADFQVRLLRSSAALSRLKHLPPTFIEAADKTRWIFPLSVARRLAQYLNCIDAIEDESIRNFFKVVLGAVLIDCSNVYVNGKGRRYRRSWQDNQPTAEDLDLRFATQFNVAFEDVVRFEARPNCEVKVLNADARQAMSSVTEPADLIVFSPPYPNSFDYTDIYNVELWTLGYLDSSEANTKLRCNTLRSHVQISRPYDEPKHSSRTLEVTLKRLRDSREVLWDQHIPEMVASYFRDLELILIESKRLVTQRGKVMLVVGDSRYAGILIDVASILAELGADIGYRKVTVHEVRRMRASAQQGGNHHLRECIVELLP